MKSLKVKVGHVRVSIKWEEGLSRLCQVTGVSGTDLQDVRIDDDLGPDVERETVLHELLHHAFTQTVLEKMFTDEQEEQIIWGLSPLILQMWRENPKLRDYLLGE